MTRALITNTRGGGSDLLPPPLSECAVYGLNTLRAAKKSQEISSAVLPETYAWKYLLGFLLT